MIRKAWDRYSSFALWPRIIIAIAIGALVVGFSVRAVGALKYLIFGNVEAKEERANTVVAEEEGRAAHETGLEATNTTIRTYERRIEVDHIVKESQDAITRADRGQQMDPAIDNAAADGLCRVHDDLCRRQ